MHSDSTPQYYYSDVIALGNDALFLSAGILAAPDSASSVLLARFSDGWGRHNVPNDFIVSIAYSADENRVYFLGKFGLIKWIGELGFGWSLANVRGRFAENRIPRPPLRGPLECIRAIGGSVFVCGWNRQIYRLVSGKWEEFGTGLPDERANLLTITGSNTRNLFVAGMSGVVMHYDGRRWQRLDSPGNTHIYCSTTLSTGQILLAGADGGIYLGDSSGFEFVGAKGANGNFWSVAEFQGQIYLAGSNNALLRFSPENLEPVEIAVEGEIATYRLYATRDRLWSAGAHDILEFDGSQWRRLDCPENR